MTIPENQQVSWWSVHEYVAARLTDDWPMVGTPAWCGLAENDPRKLAAILDAAQHWALRMETCQEAYVDAAREIRASQDWTPVIQSVYNRARYYIPRRAS
ncbi:DUF2742 domain-containing protein [Mycobacterium sp. 1274761.0]|uniref:DUF2742 domain-containing protein n=1 Tax=Mycobacterium sp. 1274761.0 TaxID=1834077 RepID=UPI0007FEAF38|nr:DUF2742 domain-containing protein [Mycobacterium sp. 1274761.0]OBK74858.1 hypothetical protein A5651_08135 [Mycobacterium sp. 1274761.0]